MKLRTLCLVEACVLLILILSAPGHAATLGIYFDEGGTNTSFTPVPGVMFSVYTVLYADDSVNAAAWKTVFPREGIDLFVLNLEYYGTFLDTKPEGFRLGIGECKTGWEGEPILLMRQDIMVLSSFPGGSITVEPNLLEDLCSSSGMPIYCDCANDLHTAEGLTAELFTPPTLVDIDIRPTQCPNPFNPRSKGLIPVAILGSADFDVQTIDVSTLQLEGVPACDAHYCDMASPVIGDICSCGPREPDGWTDLLVMIKTLRLADVVGDVVQGDQLSLRLTGALLDGEPIAGIDCVIVHGNVDEPVNPLPGIQISPPLPNPFNPITQLQFRLPDDAHVKISVFDLAGRRVDTLMDTQQSAGEHQVEWNATGLASGTYLIRVQAGEEVAVQRATLVK